MREESVQYAWSIKQITDGSSVTHSKSFLIMMMRSLNILVEYVFCVLWLVFNMLN